jgi:hypothetical protein
MVKLVNLSRKASSGYDNSRVEIVTYTNLPLRSFKLGGLPVLHDNQHHKGERQNTVNPTTNFVLLSRILPVVSMLTAFRELTKVGCLVRFRRYKQKVPAHPQDRGRINI